ncbi:MAG: DUF2330 domain-containing protein [Planctomycetota bacterium]|nr:DUF2330 domain-containing protein [Planctomycetota bacterium]
MKTTPWWFAAAALVLLAPRHGRADGCFVSVKTTEVGQSKSLVSSPKQEAILATDGQTVQVVLRTHFNAGPKELGWVVPVPGEPDDVAKADDAIFDRLDAMTAPTFVQVERIGHGGGFMFGCGTVAWSGDGGLERTGMPLAVQVEKAGRAGIFDFQVLAAQSPQDLLLWLDQHNYSPPEGAAKTFAPYVAKGWHWLAVRVRAEEAHRPTLAPHPITYRYKSSSLVFPLAISSLSAAEETEIVLYVVGAGYFGPAGWTGCTSEELAAGGIAEQKLSPSGTNYEELLRRKARSLAGRLLVTEFAQPWQMFGASATMGRRFDDVIESNLLASIGGRQALTRLRACVRREQMVEDISLEPKPRAPQVHNQIRFSPPAPAQAGGAALGAGALSACAAGGLAPRRRRAAKALAALLVALGLALLTVI